MSYANFKPTVFAANYLKDLEDNLIFAPLCSRAHDGEVSKLGQSIVFKSIGYPTISTPSKKTGLLSAGTIEELEDTSLIMQVNQVRTFYFGVGDIDKEESAEGGGIVAQGRTNAARKMAEEIDDYVAGLVNKKEAQLVNASGSEPALTKDNVLLKLDNLIQKAKEDGISPSDLRVVGTPRFIKLVLQAYRDLDTNNSEMIKKGFVGRYSDVTLLESNHVKYSGTKNTTSQIDLIPVFTKRAVGYAHPMSKTEAERPDGTFEDALKGLTLFDAKILYPKEFMVLNVKYDAAAL
ncbi:MAG: hypothetical protein AB7E61_07215 [Acholeplasmataceae bacterium]